MTAPKGTLEFSIKTKKRFENIPPYWNYRANPLNTVSVRSLTDGPLPYSSSIYSKEEIEWIGNNTNLPGETEYRKSYGENWLKGKLELDPVCTWCSSTLTLEFNSSRSGFQVTCSYCGLTGPCEGQADMAVDAVLQVAII